MQLEAQLGTDDQTRLHRARGLTDDAKEDPEWLPLKRSRALQDFPHDLPTEHNLCAGKKPAQVRKQVPMFSKSKDSPHCEAFFHFFLKHLD